MTKYTIEHRAIGNKSFIYQKGINSKITLDNMQELFNIIQRSTPDELGLYYMLWKQGVENISINSIK